MAIHAAQKKASCQLGCLVFNRAVVFDKAIDALTGLLMLCQGFFDVLVVIQRKGRRMKINKIENTKPVVLWGKKEYIQVADMELHCKLYPELVT